MRRSSSALLLGLAALAHVAGACGSSSPPPTLTINSATSPVTVGSLSPPGGRYFVEINVTLANPSPNPVPTWFYYYTLTTTDGIALSPPIDANGAVGTPCSFDVSLAPDVMGAPPAYTCNLVFEVPCGHTAAALVYDPAGVTAPLAAPPAPPTCSPAMVTGGGDGGA